MLYVRKGYIYSASNDKTHHPENQGLATCTPQKIMAATAGLKETVGQLGSRLQTQTQSVRAVYELIAFVVNCCIVLKQR